MSAQPVRYVEHVMGMPISLALRGRHADDDAARDAWRAVLEELRDADAVFSTYREDSWVSRLDRGEVSVADCPPQVAEVLALAERAERESGGAFSAHLPGPGGRRRLDPSGVVKGWAAERAAAALRALPETDHCLSAGGDVTCGTADPDGEPWRVGVEDPRDPSRVVAVVPVLTGAVATSGTTHRGQHLVDARTGLAPHGVASVTVVAGSLTTADVDATAAYAQGLEGPPGWRAAPAAPGWWCGPTARPPWSSRCPWPWSAADPDDPVTRRRRPRPRRPGWRRARARRARRRRGCGG